MITLADLHLGDIADIVGLDVLNSADRQKLFACGMVPGARVTVVRVAPLGDPLQVSLDGVVLSIRKAEGLNVTVNRISRQP